MDIKIHITAIERLKGIFYHTCEIGDEYENN